jgi:integrase/recombinase XerD
MATFKLVLRPNKRKADGTVPVYLRITEGRKTRYLSAQIAVEEKHWNANKEEVRKGHPLAVAYNDALSRLKHDAESKAIALKSGKQRKASADAVKKELRGLGASQFFPFADAYAEEWLAKGKYWQWRKVKVVIKKLEGFTGGRDLAFSDIDRGFLIRFERYMRDRLGNQTNTVAKNVQMLRGIVHRAIQDGLLPRGDDPFFYYRTKTEPTTKEKLSIEEVRALETLDLRAEPVLDLTRDAFLFSFYCAGVRFGDMCRLRWKNVQGGRLTYRMAKTQRPKSIKLMPQAEALLSKYDRGGRDPERLIFPILEREYE